MEDLQIANDEIAALKLKLADTSRPSPLDDNECSTRFASTPYGSPGSTRASLPFVAIEPPRCQKNGYDIVAAEYKGGLKKKPGLRARLLQEGRCLHNRQPGAPTPTKGPEPSPPSLAMTQIFLQQLAVGEGMAGEGG